jgi:hypothetical protein
MRYMLNIVVCMLMVTSMSAAAFSAEAAKPAAPAAPAAQPAAAPAAATTPAASVAPQPYGSDHPYDTDWMKSFHHPTDWLTLNGDIRLRWEYWKNNSTFDSDTRENITSRFRYRLRLGGTANLTKDIDFNFRMVYEPQTYMLPNDDDPMKPGTAGPTRINEVLFDKFNLTMRNFMDLPVTAVIGRQDIVFGKGWLVADGGPFDTSRTGYFDALRFTCTMDQHNTLDLVYAHDMAQEDMWLKPINSQDLAIQPTDEHDAMLYWTNKAFKDTTIEGYFLYKNDNPVDGSFPNTPWDPSKSRKAEIMTYGGAVSQNLDKNWDYRAEGAVEFGNKEDSTGKMQSLKAWGTNNVLTYSFNDPRKNATHVGWEYLSGDSRSSENIEQFDTMWGKWARWSDLYATAMGMEFGTPGSTLKGDWSNLNKFNVGHSLMLDPQWTVTGDYYLLLAPEHPLAENPNPPSSSHFGNGYLRGQLLEAYLKWQANKQLSAYLQGEYFFPGNYYAPDFRDEGMFFRVNVEYVF